MEAIERFVAASLLPALGLEGRSSVEAITQGGTRSAVHLIRLDGSPAFLLRSWARRDVTRPASARRRVDTAGELATTTDPIEIEQRFEKSYAEDDWYRHLYRTSYAYHGVHPFYMWYWGAHALEHLGDVIFVGGDPEACRRLGFRRADTMRDALEMAEQVVGRDPSLTHFHCPPVFYAQVEA